MPLAKSITLKRINVLGGLRFVFSCLLLIASISSFSQDNSPYSRYGLGNIVPTTNVSNRSMGGIAAGFNDWLNVNYANPASYGSFYTVKEAANSKKLSYGRTILDVGINIENRSLREPNSTENFAASNFLISHVMLALPLKPNWGLVFGIRPLTRISYNIISSERTAIDSQVTINQGNGGAYLPTIGTGFRIPLNKDNAISFGVNGGYLFGQKDVSSRRTLINDTIQYNAGNFQTKTTYGNLYFDAGLQYMTKFGSDKDNDPILLTLGLYGNIKQELKAKQDIVRETYFYDEAQGYVRIDSVFEQKNVAGKITYPSSYTAGFAIERYPSVKHSGWLIGVDYMTNKWSEYRFYGQPDPTVKDRSELRIGAELRPTLKSNYWNQVRYRAGFFIGDDYIYAQQTSLPVWGVTGGFGLPVRNYSRQNPGYATTLNLGFEYIKRGNSNNLLTENLFRLSVGLSLSDYWFVKKKYE